MKRFSWTGTKLKNPLNFDEEMQIDAEYMQLDAHKYPQADVAREVNHIYRLYALIVHEGYSTRQGHYFAYIKNLENHNWYRYDDSTVTKVGKDLSAVRRTTQNAYILFYKKDYLEHLLNQIEEHLEGDGLAHAAEGNCGH